MGERYKLVAQVDGVEVLEPVRREPPQAMMPERAVLNRLLLDPPYGGEVRRPVVVIETTAEVPS